jgi:DNA-binding IclR family transcriptional regulator
LLRYVKKNDDRRGENRTMSRPLASVDNALQLLLMLQDGRPLRVTDAADHLGVSRATAHRLLASLEHRRFVEQDPVTRAYLVADALVRNWVPSAPDLLAAAKPEMRALTRRLGETTHLAVLHGTSVTLIASIRTTETPRNVTLVGTTLPAHFSASGKALLAQLPLEELRRRYASEPLRKTAWRRTKLVRESDATIWRKLLAELEVVRTRGYATNFLGQNRGVNAIAAPIVLRNGGAVGALVVSAPSARTRRRAMLRYVEELKAAAAQVAARLARQPSSPPEVVL